MSKNRKQKFDPSMMVVILLVIAGVALIKPYIFSSELAHQPIGQRVPASQTEAEIKPLEIAKQTEAFDMKSVTPEDKIRVYQATLHFCVGRYHRDSCLHYLILCGDECKKLISPAVFAKAREDYWKLMQERKLSSNQNI